MNKLICFLFGHRYVHIKNTECALRSDEPGDERFTQEHITAWFLCMRCDHRTAKNIQFRQWIKK